MPIILALGRLRQADCQEFKASLDYTVNLRLTLSQKSVVCVGMTPEGSVGAVGGRSE